MVVVDMKAPSVDPNAITTAPNHEPFTLVPVIKDVLRTRYCAPGTVFLVEGIDIVPVSKTGRWQAIRLLLGDGELCVQALLSAECHRFVETGEVSTGFYIRVHHFELEWEQIDPLDQAEGGLNPRQKMVFLSLHDVTTIGWNDAYRAMANKERDTSHEVEAERSLCKYGEKRGEKAQEESQDTWEQEAQAPPVPDAVVKIVSNDAAATKDGTVSSGYDDDFGLDDAFESMEKIILPSAKKLTTTTTTTRKPGAKMVAPLGVAGGPVALPRDWTDRQTPLKLTTLHAVPTLPYAQNWTCNVLAIVASLSPVESSYLPPYKQRTARLADPSTAKRVHLTVFLDPEAFCPAIGSAVLLTGVKNHRFDGGSLKKYASDGNKGQWWWFENPYDMGWCDVAGIKEWWKQMEAAFCQ